MEFFLQILLVFKRKKQFVGIRKLIDAFQPLQCNVQKKVQEIQFSRRNIIYPFNSFIIIISKWLNFCDGKKSLVCFSFLKKTLVNDVLQYRVYHRRGCEKYVEKKNKLIFIKQLQHIEDPCGIVWHVWITNLCDDGNENDVAYEICWAAECFFFQYVFFEQNSHRTQNLCQAHELIH